jgi:small subunit ribosomal protein S8
MRNDNLTDMLLRIKNGQKAGHKIVKLRAPLSKMCIEVLKLLMREGFIATYFIVNKDPLTVDVYLKYGEFGKPVINQITRISKTGNRVYTGLKGLWNTNYAAVVLVLTTPKGIMTDIEAKQNEIGGELLFIIK